MVVKWILLRPLWQLISAVMHHIKHAISLISSFLSCKVLNEYFHNVCELDLVFNFYKVRTSQDYFFAS